MSIYGKIVRVRWIVISALLPSYSVRLWSWRPTVVGLTWKSTANRYDVPAEIGPRSNASLPFRLVSLAGARSIAVVVPAPGPPKTQTGPAPGGAFPPGQGEPGPE